MKNVLRLILVGLAAVGFAGSFQIGSTAQKQDRFSHSTPAHKKKDCSSCHSVPTKNWVTARAFPDVANFPSHAACFACHQKDIFSGNRPVFCGTCHVTAGPTRAPLLPFPVRSRSNEFSTIFPHNVHQDIIAANTRKPEVAVAHFIKASFVRAPDDPPQFNNCAICHQTRTALPKFANRVPAAMQPLTDAAADSFLPTAAFFKDTPTGHASCFACHYQGVKPAAATCAGCHSLTKPYSESAVIERYSLKFDHQQGKKDNPNDKVHQRDCMTCHVRIAQNADLKTLVDADVPFMACVTCHGDDLTKELNRRAESVDRKLPAFQCVYCHTPAVGRFPIPSSHRTQ